VILPEKGRTRGAWRYEEERNLRSKKPAEVELKDAEIKKIIRQKKKEKIARNCIKLLEAKMLLFSTANLRK